MVSKHMTTLRSTISSRKLSGASSDISSRSQENGSMAAKNNAEKNIALPYGCYRAMAELSAYNWPTSGFLHKLLTLAKQPPAGPVREAVLKHSHCRLFMFRFSNKVCLVTGATSGIGRATAVRLGREGATVVCLGREAKAGHEVEAEIKAGGSEALFIKTDVGRDADLVHAVEQTLARFQRIDVLINDAAMMTYTPLLEMDPADWDRVQSVNVRALFRLCQLCVPHMKGGAVVAISSVHAFQKGRYRGIHPRAQSRNPLHASSHCGRGARRRRNAYATQQPQRAKRHRETNRPDRDPRRASRCHLLSGLRRGYFYQRHHFGSRWWAPSAALVALAIAVLKA
jgi:hypothetical protein